MSWWDRLWQWEDEHRQGVDLTLTFLLTFTLLPPSVAVVTSAGSAGRVMLLSLIALGVLAPLAWRRTHPARSIALVYAAALLHVVGGFPVLPVDAVVPCSAV